MLELFLILSIVVIIVCLTVLGTDFRKDTNIMDTEPLVVMYDNTVFVMKDDTSADNTEMVQLLVGQASWSAVGTW